MNTTLRTMGLAALGLLAAIAAPETRAQSALPVGQWDFNNGSLAATRGTAITFLDQLTQDGTVFGTTTALGIPDIGGTPAAVMKFPVSDAFSGFAMPVNAAANGGSGTLVNQWTLLMDILWPAESAGRLRALIETDTRLITSDSDLFVSDTGGLGVNGQFDGQMQANTWYRIGFVVDTPGNVLRKYINGVLVGTQSATDGATPAFDGRWALDPVLGAQLFNDDSSPPAAAVGYVNSIQLRDVALSTLQMKALGGPSAAGLPDEIPPLPFVFERWTPRGPFANPGTEFAAVLSLGDNVVNPASVVLTLDGAPLASPTVTIAEGVLTVRNPSAGLLPVGTDHVLVLNLVGSIDGARSYTNQFRVAAFVEDFEDLVLGPKVNEALAGTNVWTEVPPPGWVVDDSGVPGVGDDATDGVTEWAGWSFANRDWWATAAGNQRRVEFVKGVGTVAIADPDEWDDAAHTTGAMYNALMTTPAIPVAGLAANSLFLKFDSSWRPECCDDDAALANDQTARITVSYDGGAPQVVMLWSSDPSNPNFHGDFPNESVTVPLRNPAGATSMRIEFGLLTAENDWWWAIDNLLVNSGVLPPAITSQPDIVTATAGDLASLSVTVSGGQPLSFQWFLGTGASRTAIPGATSATLNLPGVTLASAGIYSVRVTNPGGSVDSGPIQLIVLPAVTGSVTNGLVAHLKFDGDALDASGRDNHGTAVGAPEYLPGRLGQALRFSSARDGSFFNYVSLGTPADLQFGTDVSFTIAFWTRFTTWTGDPAFVANKNWNSGGNPGYVIATASNGGLQWNAAPARIDYDGAGATLPDDQWHHVALSWDRAGLITTYLDGSVVNVTPNGGLRDLNSGLPTNIGQDGTGSYTDGGSVGIADGTIDDVGIWRRALSEAEIKAIYRTALAGGDLAQATVSQPVGTELVAYLPFDGTLEDATGRGNNGTSVGSTPFVAGRLGQAVSYLSKPDGSSFNYVTLGRPADLNFGTNQSFSVSFWARLNSWQGDPAFLSNKDWDSGNNPGWVIATASDGRIQWNIAGTPAGANGGRRDYDSAGGFFNNGAWRHVAVVFERLPGSGRARTYVDGRRLAETVWSGADNQLDPTAPRATNIGQDGVGDYTDGNSVGVDGVMDELVIWRRALVDDDVAGLYAAGVLGVPANGANPGLTLQLPPSALRVETLPAGGSLKLSWQANAGVRLQRSPELGGGAAWQDVPGTLGVGEHTAAVEPGTAWFYRLIRK